MNEEPKEYAGTASFDTERMKPEHYTPPTPESLAELANYQAAVKSAAPKKAPCPLINPTDADAERLQAMINERIKSKLDEYDAKKFEPLKVLRITQAAYSANSKGSYAKAETRGICRNGEIENREWNMYSSEREARAKRIGPKVCELRMADCDKQVIILTDKPQKPLPSSVWETYTAPAPEVNPFEVAAAYANA